MKSLTRFVGARKIGARKKRALFLAGLMGLLALFVTASPAWAQGVSPDYREMPLLGSRLTVWIVAQLHLMFAAFILAVPMFALAIEFFGWRNKQERYDRLAHEMARLLLPAYSMTAITGALLAFFLFTLYPRFMGYLTDVFGPTMWVYPTIFIAETACLYFYYYSWDRLRGDRKWIHLLLGISLNIFGTAVMFIANSWATFMMTPAGVDEAGALTSQFDAIWNPGWWPLNVHRLVANITFGALLAAAYAAYRFLLTARKEEKAFYDWMGYTGNMIALFTMLFLPFAGYYFGFELYSFSATHGVTLMGGVLSWLFIIQAMVVAVLFVGAAYYAWLSLMRIPGSEPYRRWTPAFNIILIAGFAIWATPHTMAASIEEATGGFHPVLGSLGVMAPKMAAVTIILLVLYVSYLLYRRAGKEMTVSWRRPGNAIQWGILGLAAVGIIVLGIHGYFAPASVRIVESIFQILILLGAIVITFVMDVLLMRGARTVQAVEWGQMPRRGQYVLIALAFVIVWLMGLMGYARSGVRLNWHVFGIMEDTSVGAGLPALGGAALVVTITTLIFFVLLGLSFAISALAQGERHPEEELET